MELAIVSERKASHENSGFYGRTFSVRETPKKREVKNISEVELDRIEGLAIGKPVKGFGVGCLEVSD
jgi:hypothetical protein